MLLFGLINISYQPSELQISRYYYITNHMYMCLSKFKLLSILNLFVQFSYLQSVQ